MSRTNDRGQRTKGGRDIGRWTKAFVLCLLSFVLPTAAVAECDLPPGLVEPLNGLPMPDTLLGIGNDIQLIFKKTTERKSHLKYGLFGPTVYDETESEWYRRYGKNSFFYSVGELVKVADEKDFTKLLGELGYTFFSGSGLGRSIEIDGTINVETAPLPDDLFRRLSSLMTGHFSEAYSSLAGIPAGWDGMDDSFDLSIEVSGTKLFDLGVKVDAADVHSLKSFLKVMEGLLHLMNGLTLAEDKAAMLDFIKRLFSFDFDPSMLFSELPLLIANGSVDASAMSKAKSCLDQAFADMEKATALLKARPATADKHMFSLENPNSLLTLRVDFAILGAFFENASDLRKSLTGAASVDMVSLATSLGVGRPPWMAETMSVSLAPVFAGKYNASLVEGLIADGFAWPARMTDPTMGGLLPGFTAEQVGAVFASDGWTVRWDWSDYSTVRELVREMPDGAAKTKLESLCGKGLESPEKVAAWVRAKAVTSAALTKTAYLGASFDLNLPLLDAGDRPAEVELAEVAGDSANGFSFKIAVKVDGAATPEVVKAAAEKVSKYIFATGDLGDGFETTVDPGRVEIDLVTGRVTIEPAAGRTSEFFRVVIPKDK